jgi:hypothetical protein
MKHNFEGFIIIITPPPPFSGHCVLFSYVLITIWQNK